MQLISKFRILSQDLKTLVFTTILVNSGEKEELNLCVKLIPEHLHHHFPKQLLNQIISNFTSLRRLLSFILVLFVNYLLFDTQCNFPIKKKKEEEDWPHFVERSHVFMLLLRNSSRTEMVKRSFYTLYLFSQVSKIYSELVMLDFQCHDKLKMLHICVTNTSENIKK